MKRMKPKQAIRVPCLPELTMYSSGIRSVVHNHLHIDARFKPSADNRAQIRIYVNGAMAATSEGFYRRFGD